MLARNAFSRLHTLGPSFKRFASTKVFYVFTARNWPNNKTLRETLEGVIPAKQEQLRKLVWASLYLHDFASPRHPETWPWAVCCRRRKGNASRYTLRNAEQTKVENIIGGMRGLKAMLWEASVLDPIEVRWWATLPQYKLTCCRVFGFTI